MNIQPFIQLARPGQWIKNLFVFAGFLFSGQYSEKGLFISSVLATFIFCISSSSMYAFNDCMDIVKDQSVPSKKNRPLAKGSLSQKQAVWFSVLLALTSLLLSFLLTPKFTFIISGYLILNLAYSTFLRKIVILDVFCIALGFMLRMLAGTVAIGIPPSHWIIICTMMISLFLGFAKRYSELSKNHISGRSVLSDYQEDYLQLLLGVSTACTIITYSLYSISERTIHVHGTENLIYSVPLVIFGLFRYLYLVITQGKGSNPSSEIFSDKSILATLFLYALFIFFFGFKH